MWSEDEPWGLGVGGSAVNLSLYPQEWPDPKDWSLQDTDAFVLVYDICSPDSFDYVKALRQRIAENR